MQPALASRRRGAWPGFPALEADLRLVGLRAAGPMAGVEPMALLSQPQEEPAALILTVQNEGPCRHRLRLPAPWRVLQRVDALDQPTPEPTGADPLLIRPWELCCWRIVCEPEA
jgi:alpha-mannosidase